MCENLNGFALFDEAIYVLDQNHQLTKLLFTEDPSEMAGFGLHGRVTVKTSFLRKGNGEKRLMK